MAIQTSPWINLVVMVFLCIYHGRPIQAKVHFRYMTNYCSKTIQVQDSLVLALTPLGNLPENRDRDFVHCDLDLLAPSGMKLFAHFLQLSISPDVDHSDRLQLYDLGANNTRLTPIKGLYGKVDRTLSILDNSGMQVKDYRTSSSKMKVDYLGKPTKKSPGFRLLITNFQVPDQNDGCPSGQYLCSDTWICLPSQVTCDGNPNCGKDDSSDERGCDRYYTVTNVLAEYSLARDIILAILLPLVMFISIVISIFVLAKKYIREKINKPELPTVHFTPKNEGQVRILEEPEMYAPPAYEDALGLPRRYEPPPAYTGQSYSPCDDCSKSVVSEKDACAINSGNKQNIRELEYRPVLGSASSAKGSDVMFNTENENSEYENYRLHCVWPSDTEDDEDIKEKRRRKGGKGKVKGKRKEKGVNRANISSKNITNSSFISEQSTPGKISNSFVPSSDSTVTSVTADSSSTSASTPDLPPSSDLTAPSTSYTQPDFEDQDNLHCHRTSDEFIPIHSAPRKSVFTSNSSFDELPSDCLIASKSSCIGTESAIQVTSHQAARSDEDPPLKDVCSTTENLEGSRDRSQESNTKVHKILKVETHAGKTVTSCKMDEDAVISSGSDNETYVAHKQKGKATLTVSKNPVGNEYITCS